ncbi:hypothetical protein [Wohlfahrtiimonas populi]|uniref:hypothetical protein n=1 Tax=Wohlfahrtiimonas populi TaxID=1940240 RepID=UPI00098D6464|nr:hypothetical protein [Wohlfahrtiimonas populi]
MKIIEWFLGLFEWIDLFSPTQRESKVEKIDKIRSYSQVIYLSRIIFEVTLLFVAYGFAIVWLVNSAFHGMILVWIISASTWLLLFGLSQIYLWASHRFLSAQDYIHHRWIWITHSICFILLASSAVYLYING